MRPGARFPMPSPRLLSRQLGMFPQLFESADRSLKQFDPVVQLITRTPDDVWMIDAHCYSAAVCRKIISTANGIREALRYPP